MRNFIQKYLEKKQTINTILHYKIKNNINLDNLAGLNYLFNFNNNYKYNEEQFIRIIEIVKKKAEKICN